VTTVLRPSGDLAVPVTFGWHPYFRLPGAERATWRLALPRRRHLSLSPEGIPTGASATEPAEDAPLGARTFDDGYETLAPDSAFRLEGGGRRIRVRLAGGYRAAQVFAPEAAAVAALEPMTAPTNALVSGRGLRLAQPGAAFGASFSVEVVRDARSARYPGRPESLRFGAGRGG